MTPAIGHASLVVGGTGMLAGATSWLVGQSSSVLLVSRRADLFAPDDKSVVPLNTDWNSSSFHDRLNRAIKDTPEIVRALIWLHDPEQHLPTIVRLLGNARIVLVLGSMDGLPKLPPASDNMVTVRLGSMPAADGRRWLTHAEISAGAIAALQDGQSRTIGELLPVR